MATIVIKRGTKVPTTYSLSRIGEMAVNYQTGKVYIRASSGVICINGSSTVVGGGGGGTTGGGTTGGSR